MKRAGVKDILRTLSLWAGATLFVSGCCSQAGHGYPVISKERAIEIARREVIERYYWSNFRVVGAEFSKAGYWGVLLQRLPLTPDAALLIDVSAKDGQIIRYNTN
jgi:hypothetical protein